MPPKPKGLDAFNLSVWANMPQGKIVSNGWTMSLGAVRQKVLHAQNNDELDHIFDTDGFFMPIALLKNLENTRGKRHR